LTKTLLFDNLKELTTIKFDNVMGYLFYNQLEVCIILDIKNYTVEEYLKKYKKIFDNIEIYKFPFEYNNKDELVNKLNKNNQKYYEIYSSYGLNGWVLAEEIIIEKEEKHYIE
jgi:hypothetical protein